MPFELVNPKGLEPPVGYAHIAKITGGTMVRVAGQAPFDERGSVVGKGDFVAQFTQVIQNLKTAVEAVGGRATDYAELTIYITRLETIGITRSRLVLLTAQYSENTFPPSLWLRYLAFTIPTA